MSTAIEVLTRNRVSDTGGGTRSYYRRLQLTPAWERLVKVLDKLDNLFLLCLNPSASTRATYLAEIEEYVIPMAEAVLPPLTPYFRGLVSDCREIAFGGRPMQDRSNGAIFMSN